MSTEKFYVSLTWHDFPNGGSFATIVEAKDGAEAEALAKLEMVEALGWEDEADYCSNCLTTNQDGSGICVDCGSTSWTSGRTEIEELSEQWHVVDCWPVYQFMERQNG